MQSEKDARTWESGKGIKRRIGLEVRKKTAPAFSGPRRMKRGCWETSVRRRVVQRAIRLVRLGHAVEYAVIVQPEINTLPDALLMTVQCCDLIGPEPEKLFFRLRVGQAHDLVVRKFLVHAPVDALKQHP